MSDLVAVRVTGNVGTIEDNLDEVEASIREKVKEYSAVVVTEDSIADSRQFRASIRKEKTALDDERKAIKKRWMQPYEAFEKRAKGIIALYDEPIKALDKQLAEYEEIRKEDKRREIRAVYDEVKEDLGDWLPLESIYNPKWENATYSMKSVREDMKTVFEGMALSISTVKSMKSEFEEDALRVLKTNGSLTEAIAEINKLNAQKERFMEQARREAEQERLEKERQEAERKRLEEARIEEEKKRQEIEQNGQEEEYQEESEWTDEPAFSVDAEEENLFESDDAFGMEEDLFETEEMGMYTVTVKVGEDDLYRLKELLTGAGFEYVVY